MMNDHFPSKLVKSCLLGGALFFCGGCEIIQEAIQEDMAYASENPQEDLYQPRFVLGVFSIVRYPRATKLEREVTSGDGRSIWINTNQNFDSKRIREARAIPRPGDPEICDLKLRLDRMGKSHWQMLVAGSNGEPVALMVDSRYLGTFIPEVPKDDDRLEWVTLRVGIDSYTARGIARFAKKNYKHYNPKAADWFQSLL